MLDYWKDKIKGPTVVKFGADWCTSCREAEVILNELEEIYNKQIGFVRIDVDSCPQEILDCCDVDELPAMYVWRDAELKPATLDDIKKYCKDNWKVRGVDYYTREDASLVAKGIEAGCGTDAPGSYIAWLCKQTPVHAMEMPGQRFDVGNLESYEKIKKEYGGITC